jgi:hypothetical protein
MDPKTFAAIGGVVIGLIAGAVGSYRGIRDGRPGSERRSVVLWSAVFTMGISSFAAGVCLLPQSFFWLLAVPLAAILLAVYAVNRSRAELPTGSQANS